MWLREIVISKCSCSVSIKIWHLATTDFDFNDTFHRYENEKIFICVKRSQNEVFLEGVIWIKSEANCRVIEVLNSIYLLRPKINYFGPEWCVLFFYIVCIEIVRRLSWNICEKWDDTSGPITIKIKLNFSFVILFRNLSQLSFFRIDMMKNHFHYVKVILLKIFLCYARNAQVLPKLLRLFRRKAIKGGIRNSGIDIIQEKSKINNWQTFFAICTQTVTYYCNH